MAQRRADRAEADGAGDGRHAVARSAARVARADSGSTSDHALSDSGGSGGGWFTCGFEERDDRGKVSARGCNEAHGMGVGVTPMCDAARARYGGTA
jgi:hypothetical protein